MITGHGLKTPAKAIAWRAVAVGGCAAFLLMSLGIRSPAMAADISMYQSDPFGQSSFNTGTSWTGGLAPVAGNNYFTGTNILRTPASSSSFTFAGDALTISSGGALNYKGPADTTPVITINNLIMDGGVIANVANFVSNTSAATLTLAGTTTIRSNSGLNVGFASAMTQNVVLNSTITGTGGFYIGAGSQSGTSFIPSGTVTINGNNSGFSGGFFISRNYTTSGGATVTLNGGNASYSQMMSQATIKLGHANALGTGQLAIDAGTVDLNGYSPSIGSLSGTNGSILNNGGGAVTLTVGSDNTNSTYVGSVRDRTSGAGTLALTKMGTGALTMSGTNAYSGVTTVSAGSLTFGNQTALYGGTAANWTRSNITVESGAALGVRVGDAANGFFDSTALDSLLGASGLGASNATSGLKNGAFVAFDTTNATSGSFTYATAITNPNSGSNTLGIIKSGAGSLTLSGSSSYSGGTQLNAGVLAFGHTSALGTGTVTISSGTLRAAVSGTVANAISMNAGRFDTNGNSVRLSGAISGSNGLTKIATSGTLTLAGDNSFTGDVSLDSGTTSSSVLVVTRSTSLGTGNKTVTVTGYNKTLALDGSGGDITLGSNISYTLSNNSQVIRNLAGNNTISGSITMTLGGSDTAVQSDAGSLTLAGNISSNNNLRNLILAGSAGGTVSGNVMNGSGTVGIVKQGAGTWTLTGSNTYSSTTTGSAGVLIFGKQAALYGGTTVSWTKSNITVESGATLGVRVGDAASGYFDSAALDTLLGASGLGASNATSGLKSGALFGFDTTNATGGSFTYASAITNPNSGSNTLGIVKLGAGTLTLSGSNTYTGMTTVSAGTLSVGSGGTSGSVAGNITNNATLVFNRSDNLTYSGIISGSGSLRKLGASTLSLSGSTLTAGTLLVGYNDTASGTNTVAVAASSAVSIGTGASDQLGVGVWDVDMPSAVSSVLDLRNATTLSINVGMLRVGVANNAGVSTSAKNALLQLPGASTITAATSFVVGDSGAPLGLSSESVTTTGVGTTTVRTPTMTIGASKATGSFTLGVGTLDLAGTGGGRTALAVGDFSNSSAGTGSSFTGTADFSAGTLIASLSSLVVGRMNQTLAGSEAATLTLGTSAANRLDISGSAATNGAVVVIGRNLNVGTGVASGTVTIGNLDSASQIVATDNGTAILLGSRTSTGPATGTLNLNGGTLTITTTGTGITGGSGTSTVNFNGTTLRAGAASANWITGLTTANVQAGGALFDTNAFTVTVAQAFSGTGGLTKVGAGTLTLSSSNSHTGGTTLSAGTLAFVANALGSGTITLNGGTLRWASGNTQDISGKLALVSGSTATLDTNGNDVTLANGFGAGTSASLTKTGAGRLVLNGSTGYTGATTVNSGTLQAASNALANTSSITVNGATLSAVNYNSSASLSLDSSGLATISGTGLSLGPVTNANTTGNALDFQSTSGTITLTSLAGAGSTRFRAGASIGGTVSQGSVTVDGAAALGTVSGGTIALGGTSASIQTLVGGQINLSNNVALSIQSGTFGGSIGGAGSLTKTGAGALVLNAANSYSGATTISTGVVSIAAANALGSTSGVTIADGAGLTYTGGAGSFGRNISVTSGTGTVRNSGGGLLTLSGTLSKNGTVLRLTGGEFNVTGQIIGSTPGTSDLLVDGTSTVTLSAANTYDGPTFVNQASTLVLGANNAISSNSRVTLGNATTTGTLSMNGFTNAIGGLAFDAGGGTLRLAATSTSAAPLTASTGTMTLTNGTLDLAGSGSTAGLYRVLSAQSIAGSFTSITGTSAAYQVISSNTSVDYQQRAVLGAVTVTNPAVSIITGGSANFTYTVANSALSGGAGLSFTGVGSANVAGSSTGSATATGTSTSVSGLYFNGTGVGAGQTGTFAVSAPTAYGSTSATGTVTVNVYGHAAPSLTSGTLTLGNLHVGYGTSGTSSNSLVATNGSAGNYIVALKGSPSATSGNVSLNSIAGVAAGGSGSISATLTTGRSAGTINESFTYTFADDSTLGGALSNVGTATIAVTGNVYSGQAVWNTNGGGNWGTLIGAGASAFGSNWGANQGSPGLDAAFANTDTATFAGAVTGGTATIDLTGVGPSLKAITFNTGSASYLLSSGSITMLSDSGTASLNVNAGTHEIASSLTLTSLVSVNTLSDAVLTLSGAIGGSSGFVKTGAGTLNLVAANTYSGNTDINAGILKIFNASTFGSGTITLASGALLNLNNLSIGNTLINNGGTIINSGSYMGAQTVSGTANYTGSTAGTIDVTSGASATFSGPVAAAVQLANGASASVSGAVASTAALTVNANSILTAAQGSSFAAGSTISNAGQFNVSVSSGTTPIASTISGTGSFAVSGGGLVQLTGANAGFTGQTTVSGSGTQLAVNSALGSTSVSIDAGAILGGSGSVAGVLTGAGLVSPGNSPGILTATQFDPTNGLGGAFEFMASAPVYNAPSASLNDVLRLTNSSTPFVSSLTAANHIDVYFNVSSIANGDIFEGGFFTGLSAADLLVAIKDATFTYWVQDNGGNTSFNGHSYSLLTSLPGITGANVTTAQRTADFDGGSSVTGSVTQFVIIPEPDTIIFAGIGVAMAGWSFWKRRRMLTSSARGAARNCLSRAVDTSTPWHAG